MFEFSKINKKKETVDYTPHRKTISELIFKVLTNKILVREALLEFPSDIKDESIQTAWHALCHLEADEDLRRRDRMYAEEQNEYLEMIAFTFQKGEELPRNIINSYKRYYNEALIPHSRGIKGMLNKLTRLINIKDSNQD